MSRFFMTCLAMLMFTSSGCGTIGDAVCGPLGGSPYYRGVRMDLMATADGISQGSPLMLVAADLPFSAVADTVLVPFVAYEQWTKPRSTPREVPEEQRSAQEPAPVAEGIRFP